MSQCDKVRGHPAPNEEEHHCTKLEYADYVGDPYFQMRILKGAIGGWHFFVPTRDYSVQRSQEYWIGVVFCPFCGQELK